MEEVKLISLFDYLGKAAGAKLGEQVYKAACTLREEMSSKEITTKTYSGKVMLYREPFLQMYFNGELEDKLKNIEVKTYETQVSLSDLQNYVL